MQCETLLSNRPLASYLRFVSLFNILWHLPADFFSRRIMTVDLTCDGTDEIVDIFVRCLAALPNLHTLEVISMGMDYSDPLCDALTGIRLPQIKTLILPSMAHCLLRHCPNIDDLTCTPFRPNEDFIQSLIAGRQKLRRFAVLFPGNAIPWSGEFY